MTLTCSGDGRRKPNKLGWAVAVENLPTPCATDANPITGGDLYVSQTGTIRARNTDGSSSNRGLAVTVENLPSGNELGRAVNRSARRLQQDWNVHIHQIVDEVEQIALALSVPTPRSMDGSHGAVNRTATVDRRVGEGTANLAEFILTQTLPTPTAQDARNATLPPSQRDRDSIPVYLIREGEVAKTGVSLNPNWVEWLMGWPIGWTRLEPLPAEVYYDWATQTATGQWWLNEADIPRVAVGVPDRYQRVKAIGNGQVPLAAALAWKLLSEHSP